MGEKEKAASGVPTAEELALIGRYTRRELAPEEVYTFPVLLCDNEIDREGERFSIPALEKLADLFVGKTGIFDHEAKGRNQTARIYRCQVVREEGRRTAAGEVYHALRAEAYMLRGPGTEELIREIDGGIKKEVSVGCAVAAARCSICGAERRKNPCGHQPGERYDGRVCHVVLEEPTDAYEWSFVAVPAQRKAGVMKSFIYEGGVDLKRALAAYPGCLKQLEALEKEAQLGRSYMEGLRRELVRLAGLTDETLDLKVFSRAAEKMEEDELLEMSRVYRKRMDEIYPPVPQLRPRGAAACGDEDKAFLI